MVMAQKRAALFIEEFLIYSDYDFLLSGDDIIYELFNLGHVATQLLQLEWSYVVGLIYGTSDLIDVISDACYLCAEHGYC